jgi:hypothetical protein
VFSDQEAKANMEFAYFNGLLSSTFQRAHRIDLDALGIPSLNLEDQEVPFSEEDVWSIINVTPNSRALSLDGFTGLFYKAEWDITRADLLRAFNAL